MCSFSAKTPIVYWADSWTILCCEILMFVEKLSEHQTSIWLAGHVVRAPNFLSKVRELESPAWTWTRHSDNMIEDLWVLSSILVTPTWSCRAWYVANDLSVPGCGFNDDVSLLTHLTSKNCNSKSNWDIWRNLQRV